MRKAFGWIGGIFGLVAFGAVMWNLFGSQRDDVALAREFLTLMAGDQYAAAEKMVTPGLAAELETRPLAQVFGDLQEWSELSFPNRSSNSANGRRVTEITGTGTTVTGCESALSIRLVNGLIDAANISPVCQEAGNRP